MNKVLSFLQKSWVLILILIFSGSISVYSANNMFYGISPGDEVVINEFGDCKKITYSGSSGNKYFIPTKTQEEWQSFLNAINLLPNLSESICVSSLNEVAKILASDGSLNDLFGKSVSVSNDGNTFVVGSPGDDYERGSAYVYQFSGGVWNEVVKLEGNTSGPLSAERFGSSVAISGDGNNILIGAPYDKLNNYYPSSIRGSIYLYNKSLTGWGAPDNFTGYPAPYRYGISVDLSSDANKILVGSSDPNSTYFYIHKKPFNYMSLPYASKAVSGKKLISSTKQNSPFSNALIAVSGDGKSVVVGSSDPSYPDGSDYVYFYKDISAFWESSTTLMYDNLTSVDISEDGSTIAIGYGGYVDIYFRSSSFSNWSFQNSIALEHPSDNPSISLSLNGDIIVVGSSLKPYNSAGGHAYIYERSGSVWTQKEKLIPSDSTFNFGYSVDLSSDGKTILVGAPNDSSKKGAVYVFKR